MPNFIILANTLWDSPTGGGGHSSQQYTNAIQRLGWPVSFVQKDRAEMVTPLKKIPLGPETVVMCDVPWVDFYYELFLDLKGRGCPTIFRIVDNWHQTPHKEREFCEERELAFVRAADVVVASHPLNVERFMETRPDIGLVRNGVDLGLFWDWEGSPPVDLVRGEPTAVFVASFWDPTWIDWDSLVFAANSCPQMAVNILGPRERIKAPPLPPNIHLLGAKHHSLLPEYLRNSDIGLLPYNYARTSHSNPIKILEYLASGLPVVCCPNVSIADYPYLFHYRGEQDFADKIRLASKAEINSEYLYKILSQHTWEARLEALLAKLAAIKHSG